MKNFNPIIVKKPALMLVISMMTAVVLLTGCNSPDENMETAQSAVVEANRELEQATREYQADMNRYREEAAERIAANDSTITAFKERMANETTELKAVHEEQLDALEQKNSDMKQKLADYKGEGKEQWETFKAAFNHEMNSLGEAFEDLTDTSS